MAESVTPISPEIKQNLHRCNLHRLGYDFEQLIQVLPELSAYLIKTPAQQISINFSEPMAVRALNTALLKAYYHINFWQFPRDNLTPAVPGRVDYLHYLADLIKGNTTKKSNNKVNHQKVKVLDIGTGASCIYPLLGRSYYRWQFVASDIDAASVNNANHIITNNLPKLSNIECRLQKQSTHYFQGIIQPKERFVFTMCNPPFHQSLAQANAGSERKWQNLSKSKNKKSVEADDTKLSELATSAKLNFSGQKAELWCPGGELQFITGMINESINFQQQVLWFTCLVSKKENLALLKSALKKAHVSQMKVVNMAQGQKISRVLCWSFFNEDGLALQLQPYLLAVKPS